MNKAYELILQKIGLTVPETRVYMALLELKEAKTGEICKKAKIASSNIYPILDTLIKKGLVSYRLQNNIRIFVASSPEILNDLFVEKVKLLEQERKQINDLVESLKKVKPLEEPFSKYRYYEGLNGVKSMWHELRDDLHSLDKGKFLKIYGARPEAYQPLIPFYDEFHKVRLKRKIGYKLILPFADRAHGEKRKRQNAEVRYADLRNEAQWGVMGKKFFIMYITRNAPRAFILDDEVFAEAFEQVFDQLWDKLKP
ncbi:hypothetical protein J4457_00290 [Candidatus Woesearchaeota archaeon]|nr:hypothetical protein [Candidatus Woesearchaeota archaeon]